MRFMMIVRANPDYEAGKPVNPALLAAIGKLSEKMTRAGILLQTGALLPSSKAAKVQVSRGRTTVTDGPFAETKEVVGGFAILEAARRKKPSDWAGNSCRSTSTCSDSPTKARWRCARWSMPRAGIAPLQRTFGEES